MAALDIIFVEVTTAQNENGTTFQDITGAKLDNTDFTAGEDYLIIVQAWITNSSGADETGIRLVHGATPTEFANSNAEVEPAEGYYCYTWFTVWTAVSGEDVDLQLRTSTATTTTATADQIVMIAINIDSLTLGTDYHYSTRTASDALDTVYTATNASVTFTPNGTDDWLVLATADIRPASNAISFTSRINLDDTTLTPEVIAEGEDNADNIYIQTMARVYTPSNASHTFEQDSSETTASSGTREFSAVFAINLDLFELHADSYTAGPTAIDGNESFVTSPTQLATATIAPSASRSVFIMSFCITDAGSTARKTYVRQQVANADQPDTQTSDFYIMNKQWDSRDQLNFFMFTVETLSASATIDMDATASTSGVNVRDMQIAAFTTELVSAGGATPKGPLGLPLHGPFEGPI